MDTLRGNFADRSDPVGDADAFDPAEDDTGRDALPPDIGQDERRMQVRAYNHWASLLQDRKFPAIEDLEPDNLPDFGPCSVLLDFTEGVEDPGVSYIGDKLAGECGATDAIRTLADVPSRSLLSRITDHYMQILANQAPIGFEAEFVNQRGMTVLYRGILLPFSSDDDTIDFLYGVINWKELADQQTTDELMLEIDQALDETPGRVPQRHDDTPMTDWADGPAVDAETGADGVVDLGAADAAWDELDADLPAPNFGGFDSDTDEEPAEPEEASFEEHEEAQTRKSKDSGPHYASLAGLGLGAGSAAKEPVDLDLGALYEFDDQSDEDELDEAYSFPLAGRPEVTPEDQTADVWHNTYDSEVAGAAHTRIEVAEPDEAEMELGDWLASARELALAARSSEDRTRNALYQAIGRAYDFSLAAAQAPEEFDELVADSGLTAQDRAPMTPVVKLVFGSDYDKTRLTEYAAALSYAHRNGVARGSLTDFLRRTDGGLKGVVAAERRARREEAGKPMEPVGAPHERIASKLRELEPTGFDAIAPEGPEFALVMIRRTDKGEVVMLGEVPDDLALVERAARKLLG